MYTIFPRRGDNSRDNACMDGLASIYLGVMYLASVALT